MSTSTRTAFVRRRVCCGTNEREGRPTATSHTFLWFAWATWRCSCRRDIMGWLRRVLALGVMQASCRQDGRPQAGLSCAAAAACPVGPQKMFWGDKPQIVPKINTPLKPFLKPIDQQQRRVPRCCAISHVGELHKVMLNQVRSCCCY